MKIPEAFQTVPIVIQDSTKHESYRLTSRNLSKHGETQNPCSQHGETHNPCSPDWAWPNLLKARYWNVRLRTSLSL